MLHSRTAKTDGGTRTSPMVTEISCAHCLEDFLFKKIKYREPRETKISATQG